MHFRYLIFVSLIALFGLTTGCNDSPKDKSDKRLFNERVIQGEAQGTTWVVRYLNDTVDYTPEMVRLLADIDLDLSTYLEGSLINRVNAFDRTDTVFAFVDSTQYFSIMFERSYEIKQLTNGAFDPTVYPLVRLWGFGLKHREEVSEEQVDSIKRFVGMQPSMIDLIELNRDTYHYDKTHIRKGHPSVQLDFNAIAQGFSVDLMADLLNERGVDNYMIELGGEVYCKGINADGKPWRIAIDKPIDGEERVFQAILNVSNRAVVTSGSYRKFYEVDGQRYSHLIDPITGYPVTHSLLSATVIASDAAAADAYATAFMVMGVTATREFLAKNKGLNLEVYLIYDEGGSLQTWMSSGMTSMIEELENF